MGNRDFSLSGQKRRERPARRRRALMSLLYPAFHVASELIFWLSKEENLESEKLLGTMGAAVRAAGG
jgi:hypothetical protein